MLDWLDKLREMPESSRKKAGIVMAILLTLFIVCAWLIFLAVSKDDGVSPSLASPAPASSSFKKDWDILYETGKQQRTMIADFVDSIRGQK